MARVFLDTNYFIDAVARKSEREILKALVRHTAIISPLSIVIYCYLYKIKVPNKQLSMQLAQFLSTELSQNICDKALEGPTDDFEDNVQLHSAAEADCDFFLTSDEKLLKIKFFGKVQISSSLKVY